MNLRGLALPALAAALIGGVLGVQAVAGGGDFTPLRPADPCRVRTIGSVSTGIEGLTERVVVLGLSRAGCRLGVSREALALQLAEAGERTDTQIDAIRAGLLDAVGLLKAANELPQASGLVDEALDDSDLNGLLKIAIRALPDPLINGALKTDDVLRRTINNLDLRTLLDDLTDPDALTTQVNSAVTRAVEDALLARLRDLL